MWVQYLMWIVYDDGLLQRPTVPDLSGRSKELESDVVWVTER